MSNYPRLPSGYWTMAPLRYAAKFDPFLSLDCDPHTPGRTVDFDSQVEGLEVLGYSRTVSKNPDLVTILLDLSMLTVAEE